MPTGYSVQVMSWAWVARADVCLSWRFAHAAVAPSSAVVALLRLPAAAPALGSLYSDGASVQWQAPPSYGQQQREISLANQEAFSRLRSQTRSVMLMPLPLLPHRLSAINASHPLQRMFVLNAAR